MMALREDSIRHEREEREEREALMAVQLRREVCHYITSTVVWMPYDVCTES